MLINSCPGVMAERLSALLSLSYGHGFMTVDALFIQCS